MPSSAIADAFLRTCRERARDVAVHQLWDGRRVSFADLHDRFEIMRRALSACGVRDGATVVSLVGNGPAFVVLVAAAMDLGAALLPIGDASDSEAAVLLAQSGASAIVADRRLPLPTADAIDLGEGVTAAALTGAEPRHKPSVVLKLTSGSTDLPRAAIAHESHLIADGRHVIEAMGIAATDVNLGCLPLSHSYAIGNLVMPLILQGTAVALRQAFTPSQLAADVDASGATVFPGVPFMFEHIRARIGQLPASLRLLITAGARIDPATVRWFRERLDRKVHSFYGSSETGGIAYDASEDVDEPLHVGRPMPETTVTVDQSGRLFVTGPAVASGYAGMHGGDPESPFRAGGFLTGDLGCLDAAGRVVLTGRASPLVNVAGRKVDPAEVERTLRALPGIVDARVLGLPCDRRGQQLVAFVVASDPAATPIALRRLCAATLSPYKIPRRFLFVDHLPVDARGKTDRRALEALAAREP